MQTYKKEVTFRHDLKEKITRFVDGAFVSREDTIATFDVQATVRIDPAYPSSDPDNRYERIDIDGIWLESAPCERVDLVNIFRATGYLSDIEDAVISYMQQDEACKEVAA